MKITFSLTLSPQAIAFVQALATAAAVLYAAISNGVEMSGSVELAVIASYGHLAAFIAASRK